VTREAFTKTGMVRAIGESSMGVNELFAHEIAHAYWANLVKYDNGAEQWLSESFSEYTAALCLAMAAESEREGKRLMEKLVNQWRGNAGQIRSGVAIATANDLAFKDDLDAADRFGALYARGPLVLQAIREELARQRGSEAEGDRYFSAFMRAVVKNFAMRSASTEDLIGILEQLTKQPWRPFFDAHVYGTETPKRK
jgi:aminopeptidase N